MNNAAIRKALQAMPADELASRQIVLHSGTIYTRVVHLSRTGARFHGICSADGLPHTFNVVAVKEIVDTPPA